MDEARLAELLAAVGNHEGKALTFLAMEDEVEYGVSALHRRFVEIQGERPAFVGQINLQQKYVLYTFEPIGLVARTLAGDRYLRHIKTDTDNTATALAARLLTLTEQSATSLSQLFGKTASKAGHDRAPIRRLQALRAIHASPGELTQAQLNRQAPLGTTLGAMLSALDGAGWINYRSAMTAELKTVYRVAEPLPSRPREKQLTRAIRDVLNRRLEASDKAYEISRDEIEDALTQSPSWSDRYVRDTLQKTMMRLVSIGQVEVVRGYAEQRSHSLISIDEQQRERLGRLLDLVDAIQQEDPSTIRRGVSEATMLLAEPARVRAYMRRCFGNNKSVTNPLSSDEKQQLVLSALSAGPATSAQLLEQLSPALNKALLTAVMRELQDAELVEGVRLPRTPAKVWSRLS